jgi:hypothetical protein
MVEIIDVIKLDESWTESKRKNTFLWEENKVQLNNNLSIEGSLNITNDDDDNDNNNTNLINIKTVQTDPNKKTCYASISFNTQIIDKENKWLIGTGMDDYLGNPESFGIVNINNGVSGLYLEPNNSNWFSLSDLRLKNIISNIDNSLDKINKIRAVYYSWKNDINNVPQVGFIAQDVLEVFKEAVSIPKNPDTQYYGVSYSNMTPLLLSGIQELYNKVIKNEYLIGNNNELINSNNNLIFELKEITEINKKYIDLRQNELILLLNNKINEINDINLKQQEDLDELKILKNIKKEIFEDVDTKFNDINRIFNTVNNKFNNIDDKINTFSTLINNENKFNSANIEKINNIQLNINNKLNLLDDNYTKILKNNEYIMDRLVILENLDVKFNNLIENNDNLISLYDDLFDKHNIIKEKNLILENELSLIKEKNIKSEIELAELKKLVIEMANNITDLKKNTTINKNKIDILQNVVTNIQKKNNV